MTRRRGQRQGWQDRRELATWRRVRRFAVPARMIGECTAARERGDWRLACAAGDVDVVFDDDRPVADLLAGFAPDLLRWHLPRALGGYTTLATGRRYVLAPGGPVEPGTAVLLVRSPVSVLGSQRLTLETTTVAELEPPGVTWLAPHLWDARRASGLRAAVGADHRRVPRFGADGAPLPVTAFGAGDDRPAHAERLMLARAALPPPAPQQPATSWHGGPWATAAPSAPGGTVKSGSAPGGAVTSGGAVAFPDPWASAAPSVPVWQPQPTVAEDALAAAWDGAGMTVTGTFPTTGWQGRDLRRLIEDVDPLALITEVRRLAAQLGRSSFAVRYSSWHVLRLDVHADAVRAVGSKAPWHEGELELPELDPAVLRGSVDLDLLWHGMIAADEVHPLVRAALMPGPPGSAGGVPAAMSGAEVSVPAAGGAAETVTAAEAAVGGLERGEPVRVRCRGVWHQVRQDGGRLTLMDHSAEEVRREMALHAFGGVVGGCVAVQSAWTGRARQPSRLPRRLRAEREQLWLRIVHGGTRVLLEMLDAGLDPHLRDSRGRTLLHVLRSFDHDRLLPRLLAAGLDVNAVDGEGNTPLAYAVGHHWPFALVKALVEAGADVNARGFMYKDMSILDSAGHHDEMLRPKRPAEYTAVIGYLRGQRAGV